MYNWSIDTRTLKKNKNQYTIWRLQQLINYGLDNEKLSRRNLKKYWPMLYLDPSKRRYFEFLLWGTRPRPFSRKNKENF